MPLPTHVRGAAPDRAASAPYNFVPLPTSVVAAVDDPAELPDHDRFGTGEDLLSGTLHVTLTTRSPLYVRGPLDVDERARDEDNLPFAERARNRPDFFHTHREGGEAGPPVVPGSSLRGLLRGLVEVVGYGKVDRVDDRTPMTFREFAGRKDTLQKDAYVAVAGRQGSRVRAGYLRRSAEGWHVRPALVPSPKEPFLKVKDWTDDKDRRKPLLDADAVPGFRSLLDDDYAPGTFPVSFSYEKREGKRGAYLAVSRIGAPDAGYPERGVLVASGDMLETADGRRGLDRKNHALVFGHDPSAAPLPVADGVEEDYKRALTPFIREHFGPDGVFHDGQVVFYVAPPRGEPVRYLGHSPNFRLAAIPPGHDRAATPAAFVPPALRDPAAVDLADALFGYVGRGGTQGTKQAAYAGRVSVSDARLEPGQRDVLMAPFSPKILASPKASAFTHYLVQPEDDDGRLRSYVHRPGDDTVARGHKRYWPQGDRLAGDGQSPSSDLLPAPGDPSTDAQGRPRPDSTQHTRIRPVRPGVRFTFQVRFHNLAPHEVGALCWALRPLSDDLDAEFVHSLGMGKPLGLGAVALAPHLRLDDRRARYTALFDGDRWAEPGTDADADAYARDFEAWLLPRLHPDDAPPPGNGLARTDRIGALLTLMAWPGPRSRWTETAPNSGPYLRDLGRPNTRYMTLKEYGERRVLPHALDFSRPSQTPLPSRANGHPQHATPAPPPALQQTADDPLPPSSTVVEEHTAPDRASRLGREVKVRARVAGRKGSQVTVHLAAVGHDERFEVPCVGAPDGAARGDWYVVQTTGYSLKNERAGQVRFLGSSEPGSIVPAAPVAPPQPPSGASVPPADAPTDTPDAPPPPSRTGPYTGTVHKVKPKGLQSKGAIEPDESHPALPGRPKFDAGAEGIDPSWEGRRVRYFLDDGRATDVTPL